MKGRNQRIEEFINSLEAFESEDCQSILLATDMGAVGGGNNGGSCKNSVPENCNVTNGGNCENYNGICMKSTNKGSCINYDTGVQPGVGTNNTYPCGK